MLGLKQGGRKKDKSYTLFLLGMQIKNLTLQEAELGEKFLAFCAIWKWFLNGDTLFFFFCLFLFFPAYRLRREDHTRNNQSISMHHYLWYLVKPSMPFTPHSLELEIVF